LREKWETGEAYCGNVNFQNGKGKVTKVKRRKRGSRNAHEDVLGKSKKGRGKRKGREDGTWSVIHGGND